MVQPRIILASASPRRIQLLHQIGLKAEVMPSHRPEKKTSSDPETVVRELSRQKAEDIAAQICSGSRGALFPGDRSGGGGGTSFPNDRSDGGRDTSFPNDRSDGGPGIPAGMNPSPGPDLIIIGADTVVAIDGRILGKPRTHEEAYAMIREIAGRTHHVFTGVTVCLLEESPGQSAAEPEGTVEPGSTMDSRYRIIRTETFVECTAVHVAPMTEEEIRAYADSDEPMDKAGAYGIQGLFGRYITGIEGDYNNVVGLPVAHLYQVLKRQSCPACV